MGTLRNYITHMGTRRNYITHMGTLRNYITHMGTLRNYITHVGTLRKSCYIFIYQFTNFRFENSESLVSKKPGRFRNARYKNLKCFYQVLNAPYTLLEKCWWILLYVTNDAIAKLYMTYGKASQIKENGRTFRHCRSKQSRHQLIF